MPQGVVKGGRAYYFPRMTRAFPLILFLLAGCISSQEVNPGAKGIGFGPRSEAMTEGAAGDAPAPPPAARSVEEFDTTTKEQRIAAAKPATGGTLLGTTVASLGAPSAPGFWVETALVSAVRSGRLVYPANGKSVEVELRPLPEGSSRVSLAAFRVLEAPLTGLPVLEVYAN